MATSPQHLRWIRSGLQWRLAYPLVALRDRLRAYGYTVYDIGNTDHLDHIPPEDHTPYSETGWPITTPYGWVTAIDVMPPASAALPSLQALGAQIFADRQAGVPDVSWLKYMNWGPVSDSRAVHDQWQPGHLRWTSSDTGHIHASCRSDRVTTVSNPAELTYDPVARLRGLEVEEDMAQMLVRFSDASDPSQVWLCDGIHRRPVDAADLPGVGNSQTHQAGFLGNLGNGGAVFVSAGNPDVWGVDIRTAVKVDAGELAAALLADPAFATTLAEAAFQGSQRAERE